MQVASLAAALLSGEVTKEQLLARLPLPDTLVKELRQVLYVGSLECVSSLVYIDSMPPPDPAAVSLPQVGVLAAVLAFCGRRGEVRGGRMLLSLE